MIYSSALTQNSVSNLKKNNNLKPYNGYLTHKHNDFSYKPQLVVMEGQSYIQEPRHKLEELMGSDVLKRWLHQANGRR